MSIYSARALLPVVCAVALALAGTVRARAEAKLLVDVATGKVLMAENASEPWYPASLTKLMTAYTTLRAIKQGRITLNTLLTVSRNAAVQPPTKMGFPVGTRVTVDNALKMMLVKSANDMAVAIAEGVGGSIPKFADMMNANAARLGMTESHFVNPNGLPADHHETSARDLAILARTLILQFPKYESYWDIHSIRYGNRIIRNYNSLLDRYPGADGMKTGFICASGFNLVATATRHGRRLIAIVLGAPSGRSRAEQAAQLLQSGFDVAPVAWLLPSLGTVDELPPIAAKPPDLRNEVCGPHRHRRHAANKEAEGSDDDDASGNDFMLSSLTLPSGKFVLGPRVDTEPPVVVFTGPADNPDKIKRAVRHQRSHHHRRRAAASHRTKRTERARR